MLLGATLAASGCAHQTGVIQDLPEPIAHIPAPAVRPPAPRRDHDTWHTHPSAADAANWLPPGGISRRWQAIVIHHSASDAGNAAAFDRYHREVNHWDELGYHFVIGNGDGAPDGRIEVGPRWTKQKHGAHCKTPGNFYNDHGIGICLVGNFNRSAPTRAQVASLLRLTRFLSDRCGVAPSRIVSHGEVTHRTACPGHNLHVQRLRRAVDTAAQASVLP